MADPIADPLQEYHIMLLFLLVLIWLGKFMRVGIGASCAIIFYIIWFVKRTKWKKETTA